MKKFITFLLLITVLAVSLFGCGPTTEDCFSGEWNYSSVQSVELAPDLDSSMVEALKEYFYAETEEELVANAKDAFITAGTFNTFYLNFGSEFAYTYEPIFERETTWTFYKLTANEGFLSYATELEFTNFNPYPVVFPDLLYVSETNTMLITMNYTTSIVVTLELAR